MKYNLTKQEMKQKMGTEQTMFFSLSEPLEFSKKGDFETTLSLEIAPPSARHYSAAMKLGQNVAKAVREFEEIRARMIANGAPAEVETDAEEMPVGEMQARVTPDVVKMVLLNSSVDMEEFVTGMWKILEGTCTLDGETRLNAGIFDKIGIADKNRLLYEYISVFILALLS